MRPTVCSSFFALASLAALGCSAISEGDSLSSELELTAAQCASATPWTAGRRFTAGALVTYQARTFRCVQGHTSQSDWSPGAVAALWEQVSCAAAPTLGDAGVSFDGGALPDGASAADAGAPRDAGPAAAGAASAGATGDGGAVVDAGTNAPTCDANAWVYMGNDANACAGHVGESCGWTSTNLGQGFHCQPVSWGIGCAAGGPTCASSSAPNPGASAGGNDAGTPAAGGPDAGPAPGGSTSADAGVSGMSPTFVFGPYKDTSIHMNWNTNVIATNVSGSAVPFATSVAQIGARTVTLAFATGECGQENWGGVPGAAMASANKATLDQSGLKYVLSTGGAAGSFSCGSDAGMNAFLDRWAGPNLIGLDFDIEAGQSSAVIANLITRIRSAHVRYPGLRFSLTLATLAASQAGQSTARALGGAAVDSLNLYGVTTLNAVKSSLGWDGTSAGWPSYVTVNLMTMDYGGPGPGVCLLSGGQCQMGQSALQAAYNLHDRWNIPYANIELTPMIGGNDVQGETFTLADAATVARFAIAQGLAGVHYWSYDRDVDCPAGPASATCNSVGGAGTLGFLRAFLSAGLR